MTGAPYLHGTQPLVAARMGAPHSNEKIQYFFVRL